MADIFIGYAAEDRERITPLVKALQNAGWSVSSERATLPGSPFVGVVQNQLGEARCVIVVFTKASVDGRWVKAEADEALARLVLIPVLLDDVRPPYGLHDIQAADLIGWDGDPSDPRLRELLAAVKRTLGETPSEQTGKPHQPESVAVSPKSTASAVSSSEPGITSKTSEARPAPAVTRWRKRLVRAARRVSALGMVAAALFGAAWLTQAGLSRLAAEAETAPTARCAHVPGEGPEMVVVPGGTFQMGDIQGTGGEAEKPVHTVRVATFAIGRCEVTLAEYDAFAKATDRALPGDRGWGRGRRPVINVSWEDALAYAEWLSAETGRRYRLSTEAEWEYAARAGTVTDYWWGNEVPQGGRVWANCDGCGSEWGGKQTAPVGSFAPNSFGLSDTAGNVWEWVEDCWHGSYTGAPDDGTAWLEADGGDCGRRVIRGGAWGGVPRGLRSAFRGWNNSGYRNFLLGFRLAQDL